LLPLAVLLVSKLGDRHPAARWLVLATVHWYPPGRGDDFAALLKRKSGLRLDMNDEDVDPECEAIVRSWWGQMGADRGLIPEQVAEALRLANPREDLMPELCRELENVVGRRGWMFDRKCVGESIAGGGDRSLLNNYWSNLSSRLERPSEPTEPA
jgi:hypothetical protein